MSSQVVKEFLERARERTNERDRGTAISIGLRFSSSRVVDTLIQSVSRLPNVRTNAVLQDAEGNLLPLEGYDEEPEP